MFAFAVSVQRNIPAIYIVFHPPAGDLVTYLISGVIPDATDEGIFAQSLVSLLDIIIVNPLVIGTGKERRRRIADHDVGVIAT